MSGRWVERAPLTPSERKGLVLVGDGSTAHQEGTDEGGSPIKITRLVILPALSPEFIDSLRDDRDLPRIEVEAWTSANGRVRWLEFKPDVPVAKDAECDIPIEWAE